MIVITADDYGKSRKATDSILKCYKEKRITSASAMVFMEDSARAAELSMETELEIGLHLNFTLPFNAAGLSPKLQEHHNKVVSYLSNHVLSQVIYNPLLINSFHFLFQSQLEQFVYLYGRYPDFYNGHHHMHLCANVLLSKMIPNGSRMRRTFTFDPGEKDLINRLYRRALDALITRKYITTDSFFSILPIYDYHRLQYIFNRALQGNVEIEVHPENTEEIEFILSDSFKHLIASVICDNFKKVRFPFKIRS